MPLSLEELMILNGMDYDEIDFEYHNSHFKNYGKCYCHNWFARSEGHEHNGRVYCSKNCRLLNSSVEDKIE